MQIVAGFGLKGIKPRVWDPTSPYYLKDLKALMISYADFHKSRNQRRLAMEKGLHKHFGIPEELKVYLDNGSFYFSRTQQDVPKEEYRDFVRKSQPDWYPIPQDFIPVPQMSLEEQESCFKKTMTVNYQHYRGGYVPVIHISSFLEQYIEKIINSESLSQKTHIAFGGIVPNLLRKPKAIPYKEILKGLIHFKNQFSDKKLHVFGVGGTATLHIAALLQMHSVDSSGWRNRAARGLIQLPGTGDRMIAPLGNWRGRSLSDQEEETLKKCQCPACQQYGIDGLKANKDIGFYNRATHNLWVLLEESRLVQEHLISGEYKQWYQHHLDNTIYQPLIKTLLDLID